MPSLVLIPNQLGPNPSSLFQDHPGLKVRVERLDGLFAESRSGAAQLLKRLGLQKPIMSLAKRPRQSEILENLNWIKEGQSWGFVTDAGFPAVADPGAQLVFFARKLGISVEICPGASALTLALALSGLPSQSFCFHGYLPIKRFDLEQKLKKLQRMQGVQSHLFIETPYRNERLLSALLETLPHSWWLSACCDLTLTSELVVTQPLKQWSSICKKVFATKRPSTFVLSQDTHLFRSTPSASKRVS